MYNSIPFRPSQYPVAPREVGIQVFVQTLGSADVGVRKRGAQDSPEVLAGATVLAWGGAWQHLWHLQAHIQVGTCGVPALLWA